MDNQGTPQRNPSYIVGIGASAGGLNALEQFFCNMPVDSGMAFVVVQHLSPDFKSLMSDLLSRHTSMPVHRVTNGIGLKPDSIYLIPPKTQMTVSNEKLYLTERVVTEHVELPIDVFFHSLASDAGDRAIGIVLSGTGSDGSRGIRSIHNNGGLVLVQSPESAQFDGMPRVAISSGICDFILAPERMPSFLVEYGAAPLATRNEIRRTLEVFENEGEYAGIFALLRRSYNLDFSKYKGATVGRRIVRRMEFLRISGASDYAAIAAGDPDELDALYKDLLIGVTEFFRDKKAFQFLEASVIPQLFSSLQQDEDVRVWSAACATGEEAYSLAILLAEQAERIGFTGRVTVFATDVHKSSLNTASQGIYDRGRLSNVTPERLEKFFKKEGDSFFKVTPQLRKMVVFAPHNLLNDPPFTRLDLVCCRNLLIYFLPEMQEKVISLFHFALKKSSVLFLGSSEGLGAFDGEFEVIANQHKLFRKLRDLKLAITIGATPPAHERSAPLPAHQPAPPRQAALDRQVLHDYDLLLRKHMPPGVLIDEKRQIIHYFGNVAEYLKMPEGRVVKDILLLVGNNLHIALSAALQRVDTTRQSVVTRNVRVSRGDEEFLADVTIDPLSDNKTASVHYHISFERVRPLEPARPQLELDADHLNMITHYRQQIKDLETELLSSGENLQTTIEELQTTNEELQATNEEMMAANEELQSTNEELHSVNEELYSVNSEFERKNLELLQLTTDYNNLLTSTDIGTIFLDRKMRIRNFNAAIVTSFNLLPQDIGRPIDHIAFRLSHRDEMLADIQTVLDGGVPIERERSSGDGKWLLKRVMPFTTETGQVEGVVITFTDITHIKEVLEQKRLLAKVFEHSAEALVLTDSCNRIIAVNGSFTRLTGYSQEEALGQDPKILKSGREPKEFYTAMWESLLSRNYWQGEIWDKRRDGSFYPKWLTISVIRNEQGEILNYIAGFSDITERKQAEQKIEHLAHHDSLTNLPNRFSLGERLSQSLEQAKRAGYHLVVMFLDLDRFKNINDSLGHHIGDKLLSEVAARLQNSVRSSDIVSRIGGDEFVVVLPQIQSGVASVHFVDKIRHTLSQPYLIDGHELHNSSSIGVCVFPHDGETVEELMKNADTAMYHAKSQGRNNYQFFRSDMHTTANERLVLENDLRLAVERNELFLHYQPQVDAMSGNVVAVEALVRWQHPVRGVIPPGTFIPIAEESGLILQMGAIILEAACRQLATWLADGIPPLRMAVNLSVRQFRQITLPDMVADIIARTGIDARLLELEITESAAMEHPEEAVRQLGRLKEMQVQLSIDDFGTGYSSLSYLKLFPVSRLKIDRSFVKDIETDADGATIAAAIISLAHSLGMEVTAEGVETEAQLTFLAHQRCDHLQGFFFSRPLPVDLVMEFIRNNKKND
ncbi:MAG: EAL domain-containing protein [Desulfuromonadales bacterium]